MNKIEAELKILRKSGQRCIEVTVDGYKDNIWDCIVEHCCKDYSNNDLKEIFSQINNQIKAMNQDDVPPAFVELYDEFKKVMVNRGIIIDFLIQASK